MGAGGPAPALGAAMSPWSKGFPAPQLSVSIFNLFASKAVLF